MEFASVMESKCHINFLQHVGWRFIYEMILIIQDNMLLRWPSVNTLLGSHHPVFEVFELLSRKILVFMSNDIFTHGLYLWEEVCWDNHANYIGIKERALLRSVPKN